MKYAIAIGLLIVSIYSGQTWAIVSVLATAFAGAGLSLLILSPVSTGNYYQDDFKSCLLTLIILALEVVAGVVVGVVANKNGVGVWAWVLGAAGMSEMHCAFLILKEITTSEAPPDAPPPDVTS